MLVFTLYFFPVGKPSRRRRRRRRRRGRRMRRRRRGREYWPRSDRGLFYSSPVWSGERFYEEIDSRRNIFATILFRPIDRFHSRGQQLCKFIGTKESFYIRLVVSIGKWSAAGEVHAEEEWLRTILLIECTSEGEQMSDLM